MGDLAWWTRRGEEDGLSEIIDVCILTIGKEGELQAPLDFILLLLPFAVNFITSAQGANAINRHSQSILLGKITHHEQVL